MRLHKSTSPCTRLPFILIFNTQIKARHLRFFGIIDATPKMLHPKLLSLATTGFSTVDADGEIISPIGEFGKNDHDLPLTFLRSVINRFDHPEHKFDELSDTSTDNNTPREELAWGEEVSQPGQETPGEHDNLTERLVSFDYPVSSLLDPETPLIPQEIYMMSQPNHPDQAILGQTLKKYSPRFGGSFSPPASAAEEEKYEDHHVSGGLLCATVWDFPRDHEMSPELSQLVQRARELVKPLKDGPDVDTYFTLNTMRKTESTSTKAQLASRAQLVIVPRFSEETHSEAFQYLVRHIDHDNCDTGTDPDRQDSTYKFSEDAYGQIVPRRWPTYVPVTYYLMENGERVEPGVEGDSYMTLVVCPLRGRPGRTTSWGNKIQDEQPLTIEEAMGDV